MARTLNLLPRFRKWNIWSFAQESPNKRGLLKNCKTWCKWSRKNKWREKFEIFQWYIWFDRRKLTREEAEKSRISTIQWQKRLSKSARDYVKKLKVPISGERFDKNFRGLTFKIPYTTVWKFKNFSLTNFYVKSSLAKCSLKNGKFENFIVSEFWYLVNFNSKKV